jgi:hypothetical protein
MLRRQRFHDLLARPAGKPGPVCDDQPVLCRNHVEPLGGFFADHMHRIPATQAVPVGWCNRFVNVRQIACNTPRLIRRYRKQQRRKSAFFVTF